MTFSAQFRCVSSDEGVVVLEQAEDTATISSARLEYLVPEGSSLPALEAGALVSVSGSIAVVEPREGAPEGG